MVVVAAEHSGACSGGGVGGNAGWLLYALAIALRHHHRHCRCWGLAHTCPTGAVLTGYKIFLHFDSPRVDFTVMYPGQRSMKIYVFSITLAQVIVRYA